MERADELLKQPDLYGDRVLMLVQQVTAVSGKDRKEDTTSAFFDKGSTCSMITSGLAHRLGLPTEKKVLVVESFMETRTLHSQFTVIELLREDGSLEQIRAYVVDKITNLGQVEVPDEIRLEYSLTTPWPSERYSGEVEILIGMEELAIHPRLIEMQGTLGVFKSSFSPMPILAGRHDRVFPAHTKFSQACHMIRTIPGAGGTQAIAAISQSHNGVANTDEGRTVGATTSIGHKAAVTNDPVQPPAQFSAPSKHQISHIVSTDDKLSLGDRTPHAVDTTNHDASDTTVSAAEGTHQSEGDTQRIYRHTSGDTMAVSEVTFPAVFRTVPMTEAIQAVPETASDPIPICDRVVKGIPGSMTSSNNLQERTISPRKVDVAQYPPLGTVSADQLMAPWPANSYLLPSSADSTSLGPAQDPFTSASPGSQVHTITPKDNLPLGPHSPGSSEETSPPPHAGSTALSNHSAVGQPAGHQILTADPEVQCRTPSETVHSVSMEPWTVKQLLTILMISSATMALIRQAGQHPDNGLGTESHDQHHIICYSNPWPVTHNNAIFKWLLLTVLMGSLQNVMYDTAMALTNMVGKYEGQEAAASSVSSENEASDNQVKAISHDGQNYMAPAHPLYPEPKKSATKRDGKCLAFIPGKLLLTFFLGMYHGTAHHRYTGAMVSDDNNLGRNSQYLLHVFRIFQPVHGGGHLPHIATLQQEVCHNVDVVWQHEQQKQLVSPPRAVPLPRICNIDIEPVSQDSSPPPPLLVPHVGYQGSPEANSKLLKSDLDLLHDDPPEQHPGRDALLCQVSGPAQTEHNQDSQRVLQQSGHKPQHQQVPPEHSQHHLLAVIEQAGLSQGSSLTNMTIMKDECVRKLVMIGTHQPDPPVLERVRPVHVEDSIAKGVPAWQKDSKEPGAVSGITEVGTNQLIVAAISVNTVVNNEESHGDDVQVLLLSQALLAIQVSQALPDRHLSLQEVALYGPQDTLALYLQQITLVHQATPVVQRNKNPDTQVHRPRKSSLLAPPPPIDYDELHPVYLLPNQHPDGIQQVRDTRNILLQWSCVSNSNVRHLLATHAAPHQLQPLGHHQNNIMANTLGMSVITRFSPVTLILKAKTYLESQVKTWRKVGLQLCLQQLQNDAQPISPQLKPPDPGQVIQPKLSPGHCRPSNYHTSRGFGQSTCTMLTTPERTRVTLKATQLLIISASVSSLTAATMPGQKLEIVQVMPCSITSFSAEIFSQGWATCIVIKKPGVSPDTIGSEEDSDRASASPLPHPTSEKASSTAAMGTTMYSLQLLLKLSAVDRLHPFIRVWHSPHVAPHNQGGFQHQLLHQLPERSVPCSAVRRSNGHSQDGLHQHWDSHREQRTPTHVVHQLVRGLHDQRGSTLHAWVSHSAVPHHHQEHQHFNYYLQVKVFMSRDTPDTAYLLSRSTFHLMTGCMTGLMETSAATLLNRTLFVINMMRCIKSRPHSPPETDPKKSADKFDNKLTSGKGRPFHTKLKSQSSASPASAHNQLLHNLHCECLPCARLVVHLLAVWELLQVPYTEDPPPVHRHGDIHPPHLVHTDPANYEQVSTMSLCTKGSYSLACTHVLDIRQIPLKTYLAVASHHMALIHIRLHHSEHHDALPPPSSHHAQEGHLHLLHQGELVAVNQALHPLNCIKVSPVDKILSDTGQVMFSTYLGRSILHQPWPSKRRNVHQNPQPHLDQETQQVKPIQRDSITTGTSYMRLMLIHTHKQLWPCLSSKWFTEIEQLHSYNHHGLSHGHLPLIQVNCLLHHILCVQCSDKLFNLTSVLGLASGLQYHHAGADQYQPLDHIIHGELVPQSDKMRDHMTKYKGDPIRFTVIRLFTFSGYNEFDVVRNITFNKYQGDPINTRHSIAIIIHHLNLHDLGAEGKLAQEHHPLLQYEYTPRHVGTDVVLQLTVQDKQQRGPLRVQLALGKHNHLLVCYQQLPLDKPELRQVHHLHHRQEVSASSYPDQPKTNQKGYKNSTNMGTSLMRVQDNNGPQHQDLVPLPMQHLLHLQLPVHELSAEIKLAHDHHKLLQCDLQPVHPSVVLIFNIQAVKQVQDSTGPQLQHPVPLPLQHLLLLYRQLLDLHAHCTESKLTQEYGLPLHGNHQPVGPAVVSLQGIHHTHHQEVSGTLPQQLQGQSLKRQVHIQILKHGHKIIFTEVVIPSMCDVSLIKKGTTVQPHTTIAIELAFHFPEPGAHSPRSQCLQLVLLPRIDAQFLSQSL